MSELSRREFLGTTAAGIVGSSAIHAPDAAPTEAIRAAVSAPRTAIRMVVNGRERDVEVEDRWTLAELLRDHLRLTGTKVGCDRGECGACTVLLDGAPIYGCSYLAVWADGPVDRNRRGTRRPAAGCTRCSKHSSITTRRSAASARPAS